MKYRFDVCVGPVAFRIGSAWRAPVDQLAALYVDYPCTQHCPHFTVRLEPARPWRRPVRAAVAIRGDHMLPDALPLPLSQGLLAAEMGMNLQVALGERRFLLIHAASVERAGQGLILSGESGSGKSTLSALLAENGWRFMGDEFVLIDPESGAMVPFPRPISLKNAGIDALEALLPECRFGPRLTATPKGDIRHLKPSVAAIEEMHRVAIPRCLVFPRFGFEEAVREVPAGEAFVRLTQASTNYTSLGERGFDALTRLVRTVRSFAIDYPDTATALKMIGAL